MAKPWTPAEEAILCEPDYGHGPEEQIVAGDVWEYEGMLTHFSLFSGVGGLDLASEWAGFQTVGQCEIDEYCSKVLEKHWPDVPKWGDIRDVTRESVSARGIGRIDLLSGGFPCQPHSCAGKRRASADERDLWGEFARVICEFRPGWVLAENVRGLLSSEDGRFFSRVLADLAGMGYHAGWCVYGANAVGAPHRRERVFIVGYAESNGNCQVGTVQKGQMPDTRGVCSEPRDVAHTNRTWKSQPQGSIQKLRGWLGDSSQNATNNDSGARPTQSRLGRDVNEFSAGMDGGWPAGWWPTPNTKDGSIGATIGNEEIRVTGVLPRRMTGGRDGYALTLARMVQYWPSSPSYEQHEWEPPRIATGIKDRVARLKALGNAVVPAQVYPILQAIADIEAQALSHSPRKRG